MPSLRDATYAIVDVETTGLDPRVDRVVEIAALVVRHGRTLRSLSTIVDPGIPIPARASAIHHLTDTDVAGQPRLDEVLPLLERFCGDAIVVAHNAAFDLAFLAPLARRPSLCTLRFARHVFPDLDAHGNQTLRYALSLGVGDSRGAAHRAADDAAVTAALLRTCLARWFDDGGSDDHATLAEQLSGPVVYRRLPFGKHRGLSLFDVPTGYLQWMRRSADDPDARYSAECELARRAATGLAVSA